MREADAAGPVVLRLRGAGRRGVEGREGEEEVIVNGWLDWAERRDGHPAKVYSQPNSGRGIACHSIVGDLPGHSVPWRFMADDRVPGQPDMFTPQVAASVMFILYKDGHLIQMYPVTASTWTSGSAAANTNYWAIEAEGGYNPTTEPLTRAAEDTFIRHVTEWEAHTGQTAVPGANILQHKNLAQMYHSDPTACASDRYLNAWARIDAGERYGGDDMTPEDKAKLDAVWQALTGGIPSVIDEWNANRNSLLTGYALEQGKLADHLSGHPNGAQVAPGTKLTVEVIK